MTHSSSTIPQNALNLARRHIRSRTRSPRYFVSGDRLASIYLGNTLGVGHDICRSVGTDIAAVIDSWYEHLLSEGEPCVPMLVQTARRLQAFLEPSAARDALPELCTRMEVESCSLFDVACAGIAAITEYGHALLAERTSREAARDWLILWQGAVWNHNHQQERHCGLSLVRSLPVRARQRVMIELGLSDADLRLAATTFSGGAREYLVRFSETGAAAMALVGAVAFAQKLKDIDLTALITFLARTPELLSLLCRIFRLAQDLSFDASEPMSTGVFALAAERNTSIALVDARTLPIAELSARLREEWMTYGAEYRTELEKIFTSLPPESPLRPAVSEIVSATNIVASSLCVRADNI